MEASMQPDAPASTSCLENLPVELFRQVTSYLAFFDKKALQVTSKQCYLLAGPFTCPDLLLWKLHCCRAKILCHPESDFISDVMDLKARTLDCVNRATWIELSQGQEARDHHLAFLDAWDSTEKPKFSPTDHIYLMYLVTLVPRPPGWQQTPPLDSRYKLLLKMVSNLHLLQPKWTSSKIFFVAANVERRHFEEAPDQATYVDECRRASSAYVSPILQPYFNEAFPRSNVAYFCLSFIANYAESVVDGHFADPNGLRHLGAEAQWQQISRSARDHMEELGTNASRWPSDTELGISEGSN